MRLSIVLLIAIACGNAHAARQIVMYHCTDAQGAVTVQNDVPCPKGNKQEKHVIDAPAPAPVDTTPAAMDTMPAAAPPPATSSLRALTPVEPTASIATTTASTTADTPIPERGPPPALHRCGYRGDNIYFSDSATPAPRCLALQTFGLDGNPDTGAGQACEMIQDQCEPVAEDGLCAAWQQRLRDAEAAAQTGAPKQPESATVEFERVRAVVDASVCGRQGSSE